MKVVFGLLLVFLLTSFCHKKEGGIVSRSKWVISENSKLTVNGRTNINRFSCSITAYPKTDTIFINQDKTNNIALSGVLNIAVKNFDCNNDMMTKQLRKTLKEDKFAMLRVRFLSLKEAPSQKLNVVKGIVEITIAGVAKKYEICYQLDVNLEDLVLTGNQAINFSDFNLEAPRKIGRLVQAKDELIVAFNLNMKLVP